MERGGKEKEGMEIGAREGVKARMPLIGALPIATARWLQHSFSNIQLRKPGLSKSTIPIPGVSFHCDLQRLHSKQLD